MNLFLFPFFFSPLFCVSHILLSNRSASYAGLGEFEKAYEDAVKVTKMQPDWYFFRASEGGGGVRMHVCTYVCMYIRMYASLHGEGEWKPAIAIYMHTHTHTCCMCIYIYIGPRGIRDWGPRYMVRASGSRRSMLIRWAWSWTPKTPFLRFRSSGQQYWPLYTNMHKRLHTHMPSFMLTRGGGTHSRSKNQKLFSSCCKSHREDLLGLDIHVLAPVF
jgi:hypothetical protein